MRTYSLPALLLLSSLLPLAAQNQHVELWFAGSLLGRMDPFPEKLPDGACPDSRCPLGGLVALSAIKPPANAYFLVTGNNFPNTPASAPWPQLANLHSDVTALGREDFLRIILPATFDGTPPQPHFSDTWVKAIADASSTHHLLASNVAVRKHQKNLNKVRSASYTLNVASGESVPWTTASLSFTLQVGAGGRLTISSPAGTQVCEISKDSFKGDTLTCKVDLRPATQYKVVYYGHEFTFETDRALTPWANPAALDQFPAALLQGKGAPVLVMAMIDPAVRSLLGTGEWIGPSSISPGTEAELVFLPPKDTAAAIFKAAGNTAALPVLLSDLDDATLLPLLLADRRWRVVAVQPESNVLGRDPLADNPLSRGDFSIVHAGMKNREQAWVRPEWIGETVVQVRAEVAPDPVPALQNTCIHTERVTGKREVEHSGKALAYLTKQDGAVVHTSQSPIYPLNSGDFKTTDAFVRLVMDAMRAARHSQIAIGDKSMIDDDILAEIRDRTPSDTQQITRKELIEILWRHDLYVTIPRLGSELGALLTAIAALPTEADGGYCVLGVEKHAIGALRPEEMLCSIPTTIDDAQLRINERYLDPNMHYGVTMPLSLAEKLKVDVSRTRHSEDLVRAVDAYLSGLMRPAPSTPAPPAPSDPAPYTNSLASRLLAKFKVPPVTGEFSRQTYLVPSPDKNPSTFGQIPLAGESVQHQVKFTLDGELHLTPVELKPITFDLFSKAKISRSDLVDDTYAVQGVARSIVSRTLSPDRWTNGAQIYSEALTNVVSSQWERLRRSTLHFTPVFKIEPYFGYFWDSSFFHAHTWYALGTPAAPKFVTEDDRKLNYRYFEPGVRIGDIKYPFGSNTFSLKGFSYSYDIGTNFAAIDGFRLTTPGGNTATLPVNRIRYCGIPTLLGGNCKDSSVPVQFMDSILILDGSRLDPTYFIRREDRYQFTGGLEFARGADPVSQSKLNFDWTLRFWRQGASDGKITLEPQRSSELNLKAALPLGHTKISFGPYARLYIVEVRDQPGIFRTLKIGFTLTFQASGSIGHGKVIY